MSFKSKPKMFIVVIKIDTCKFYFSFFIEYVLLPVVPGLEGTPGPRRTSWTKRRTSESILIIVQIERRRAHRSICTRGGIESIFPHCP